MLALSLLLLTLPLTATPGPETFDGIRERALEAYKARDYKRACALYERAAKQQPEHAAVRADLGLCLAHLGKKAEAAREGARAVFLARPNREGAGPEDERTRQSAYFNLFKLGERLTLPESGQCAPLRKAPGCGRAVQACARDFDDSVFAGRIAQLALSTPAARFPSDPEFSPTVLEVIDFQPPESSIGPTVTGALRTALVLVWDERQRYLDRCGTLVQWTCSGSEAVRLATEACVAARGPCDEEKGEDCSDVRQECFDHFCATAAEHPTPQIAEELADAERSEVEACNARPLEATRCTYVHADACAGVVGVVCETGIRGTTTGWTRRVGEVRLAEEPAH